MRHLVLIILILSSILLSGCQTDKPPELEISWQYSDLRSLDAADATLSGADILAVYLRQSPTNSRFQDWQIRLDFLELSYQPECDIYIAFDSNPGELSQTTPSLQTNIDWDTILVISASGQIRFYDASFSPLPAKGISVFRDPLQDIITIDLSGKIFQPAISIISFQVITTLPGSKTTVDSSSKIISTGYPPQPAQALLAFWNTFPAFFPAQVLRRWDGAHTGPRGNRHGLFNLLTVAQNHSAPLLLLDLKYPSSLSALDYAGGMDLIRNMLDNKLLMLPDPQPILSYSTPVILPDEILSQEMSFIQSVGLKYQLPKSQAIYSVFAPINQNNISSRYNTIFLIQSPQASLTSAFPEYHLSRCAGKVVVPIPTFSSTDPYYEQTQSEGPSLALRRALIANAIRNTQSSSSDPSIMILGGELPNSSWGIPDEAEATLDYFDNHPWIHLVGQNDLAASAHQKSTACTSSAELTEIKFNPQTIKTLEASPKNLAFEQAIQIISTFTTPIFPDSSALGELRQNYFDQIDALLEVARWDENPYVKSDCSIDFDQDGQADCVLSSDRFFLIIDSKNGGLQYAFFINQGNLHQILGPSSLLATGLSSPETWDLSAAELSDPTVIPGAFWGEDKPYQIDESINSILFTSPVGTKSYTLSPQSINILITEKSLVSYQIPFIFDPWIRFTSNWIESAILQLEKLSDNSYTWEYGDGSIVVLEINHPMTVTSFADSLKFMSETENPDMDYPQGHYLPMPLIIGEIERFSPPLNINLSVR